MIYKAVKGSTLKDQDAQVIGERLSNLMQSGPVTPEDVLQDAKPKRSPIHDYFEWDNESAANEYRLNQARYYMRSIEVIVEMVEQPVRAFHVVNVKTDTGDISRGYLPIVHIKEEPDLLSQVIESARRELVAWQRRYSQYQELEPANVAIQQVIAQLEGIAA